MAKVTLSGSVKSATITVPDRTARVQKLRETPQEIQLTHIVKQPKGR